MKPSVPPYRSPALWQWSAIAVVCIPIAVAAVHAALGDWVPSGDDAYFTVRARDVLTSNHPLLGAWSSGSLDLDTPINNLGPIQADLLAPFTRWTPMGGTAIGVAVTNIAAIAAIGWLVGRIAGRHLVPVAMCAVGLLTWTMGSEMLITPRQHQYLILPYLCLLVAAWAVASGDRWAIVVAVIAGSLTVQTHLSYPVLALALIVVMIAGQIVTTRSGEAWGGRLPLVVGAVLVVLLWSQTLVDQFAGEGNLGNVLTGSGGTDRAGWSTGARLVARILVSLDTFVRPGYRQFDESIPLASNLQTFVFWVLVVAAVVAVVRSVRRRGWQWSAGPAVAVVAVFAGVVNAALLPTTEFGITIGNYRWLWATGTFVLIVALVVAARAILERERADARSFGLVAASLVLCVVVAAANIPYSMQLRDAERYREDQRNVADLLGQLDAPLSRDIQGPVIVDESEMYFGHPYTYPLLVTLQEHGIEFRFREQFQERRFGEGRLSDGTETETLALVTGARAESPESRIAYIGGDRPVGVLLVRR